MYMGCAPYPQGKALYKEKCANCHGDKGQGLVSLYPSLKTSKIIRSSPGLIPCLVLHGTPQDSNYLNPVKMPANPNISEADMTNLINYLLSLQDNQRHSVALDSVRLWMDACN